MATSMSATQDLEVLAEKCLEAAKVVKDYLAANGCAQPSFDQNGPAFFPKMSFEAENAKAELLNASKALYALAAGPDEPIGRGTHNMMSDISAFRYVFHFKIAPAIPLNKTISYMDLAKRTRTNEAQLAKVVRQLIQSWVFDEPAPGFVTHTAASKHLLDKGLAAYNAFHVIDSLPYINSQLAAIEKWGHGSQEPNETGSNLVYGNEESCYYNWQDHPETLERFSNLMVFAASLNEYAISHAVAGYNWTSPTIVKVVDVAGNMGHCSIEFARVNLKAEFVVQDLPEVVARATHPATTILPTDLAGRVSFMAHSFYDPQPIIGADVYFFRWIMHDYSDKYCTKILNAIVPAMRENSRILIMDMNMPEAGSVPRNAERIMRSFDMTMMLLSNATERDLGQWKSLIAGVDPRLKITNVIHPQGSISSLFEIVLEGAPRNVPN